METKEFVRQETAQAQRMAIATIVLGAFGYFFSESGLGLLAVLGCIVSAWLAVFSGSVYVFSKISASNSMYFQSIAAMFVALLGATYFYNEAQAPITFASYLDWLSSWANLLVLAIIGYLTIHAGTLLHKDYPFRGLLVLIAFFFVLHYVSLHTEGPIFSGDIEDEYSSPSYPPEDPRVESVRVFVQYTLYVLVGLAGLIIHHIRLHPEKWKQ